MPRRIPKFNSEDHVQLQVCDYLRLRYPGVLFRSDYASGLKLTMPQAVKHKRLQSERAWPDLLIYEPRGRYQGLALELKKEGVKVYKLDGALRSDQHIQEQAVMLEKLAKRGYKTAFSSGFEPTIKVIDEYFGGGGNASVF